MATLRASRSAVSVSRQASARPVVSLPARRPTLLRAVEQKRAETLDASVPGFAPFLAAAGAVTTLFSSGNALAASELAQIAASDNRGSILLTLLVPVLGWVAFNIAGPALNQLENQGDFAKAVKPENRSLKVKRSVVGPALGLGAAGLLAATGSAEASELMQLAASDNRGSILLTLLVPVLGWVAFNIAGPALNQLENQGDFAKAVKPENRSLKVKRSVVGPALGLGAAGLLAAAGSAEAATELVQLAATDNRGSILLTLLVPVLGWVAFNIAGPALNQLKNQGDFASDVTPERRSVKGTKGGNKRRAVVGPAIGLGAAGLLAAAGSAEASELMQLAASDSRGSILLTLLVPVIGWVAFNIAGPALNQLEKQGDFAKETSADRRSLRVPGRK